MYLIFYEFHEMFFDLSCVYFIYVFSEKILFKISFKIAILNFQNKYKRALGRTRLAKRNKIHRSNGFA